MERLNNAMRAQAARQAQLIADSRMGIVTSYDPDQYACKVQIMPEGAFPAEGESGESGWIKVQTIWSGPGWGVYCPPSVGDQVFVAHVEGDTGSGQIIGRVYDASHLPIAVQSGEFWMVHASGAFFKFTNDGNVSINSQAKLLITVASDCDLTVDGNINATVTGNIEATAQGNASVSAQGTATISGTAGVNINSPASVEISGSAGVSITTDGNATATINGSMTATATGPVSLTAPSIALN
ncbi:phage baseplate assembly protein V [Paraburkholderia fungorum]|uniref:phage baseplate assembly protein V n=1 Tax=Paraburkholderia fungorum TaxID=134537 RepID=UPI0038B78C62